MIILPKEYIDPIRTLIQYSLQTYCHDTFSKSRLVQVLDKSYRSGDIELTEEELYEIRDCASTATANIAECSIDKETVWSIWQWACDVRQKSE